ncbi:MAG: DUF4097 family beta strand repeat-containing protein [Flavihumibacter sp.]
MKALYSLAMGLVLGSSLYAQDAKPYLVKEFSAAAVSAARMETSGGNISVEGDAANTRLEVYVVPSNNRDRNISAEELKSRLERDFDLTIDVSGGKLTAIAKSKNHRINWNRSVSISFRLYAPKNLSTDLATSGGNISLDNLSGATQVFRTSGGNLAVNRVSGDIRGRTSGGNINMRQCSNQIELTTSGGNIQAENSQGTIKLSTSGGNLVLSALDGKINASTSGGNVEGREANGELVATTSGGNVRLDGIKGSLRASTSGGDMAVAINSLGDYVKLDNSGGNISLVLPQGKGMNLNLRGDKIKAENGALNNFSGSTDEHSIKGSVNGGGTPIDVHSGSGRINLSVR